MRECVPSQYLQGYCAHALHPTHTRRQRDRDSTTQAQGVSTVAQHARTDTRQERDRERHTYRGTECAMSESWLAEANYTDTTLYEAQLAEANYTHNRTFVHCANASSNHRTFVRLLLEQTLQPFKALKDLKKLAKKNKKNFKKDLTNERFYAIIDLSEREREVRKAQPNPSSVCETPRSLKGVLRSESGSLTVRALLQRLF